MVNKVSVWGWTGRRTSSGRGTKETSKVFVINFLSWMVGT